MFRVRTAGMNRVPRDGGVATRAPRARGDEPNRGMAAPPSKEDLTTQGARTGALSSWATAMSADDAAGDANACAGTKHVRVPTERVRRSTDREGWSERGASLSQPRDRVGTDVEGPLSGCGGTPDKAAKEAERREWGHGLDEGLVGDARERYLQGAEDITTALDELYKRTKLEGTPAIAGDIPEGC